MIKNIIYVLGLGALLTGCTTQQIDNNLKAAVGTINKTVATLNNGVMRLQGQNQVSKQTDPVLYSYLSKQSAHFTSCLDGYVFSINPENFNSSLSGVMNDDVSMLKVFHKLPSVYEEEGGDAPNEVAFVPKINFKIFGFTPKKVVFSDVGWGEQPYLRTDITSSASYQQTLQNVQNITKLKLQRKYIPRDNRYTKNEAFYSKKFKSKQGKLFTHSITVSDNKAYTDWNDKKQPASVVVSCSISWR